METFENILFIVVIASAFLKMALHFKLISSKENISHLKKPLLIGILGQPFIPIIREEKAKTKNAINLFVVIFYISSILLILLQWN